MRRSSVTIAALVLAVATAGCGGAAGSDSRSTPQPAASITPPEAGRRWESYAAIQFQVPSHWGWNSFRTPLSTSWCAAGGVSGTPEATTGSVNRWGQAVFPAILCDGVRPTDTMVPSVDLGFIPATTGEGGDGLVEYGDGWVTATVTVAGVTVAVTDRDAEQRELIVASIRPVAGADANGCPLDSDLRDPDSRPLNGAVPGEVSAASICRYVLPEAEVGGAVGDSPLLASSRLLDQQARDVADAILSAPRGSGPDDPDNCITTGGEMVVVRFTGPDGEHEVAIRYDGGVGNGVDDGVTTRVLTATVTDLVLTGPHTWSGSCIGPLLKP